MTLKLIKYIKKLFPNKKEQISVIDFDKVLVELRKADKYYISFRMLNRWGFYFQGLNCLLFSLETFFKLIYILNIEKYSDKDLIKIGHNLKRAFKKAGLDKKQLDLVFKIVSVYGYTEIRYNSPDIVNELNQNTKGTFPLLNKLNEEILMLHKIIVDKTRILFKNQFNEYEIMKYHTLESDEKKKIIDDCLSNGDLNYRLDRC